MALFLGKKLIKKEFLVSNKLKNRKKLIYSPYIIEISKWASAHFFLEVTKYVK